MRLSARDRIRNADKSRQVVELAQVARIARLSETVVTSRSFIKKKRVNPFRTGT